jgi:nitrous oxidase accessory protein NosD
VFITQTASTDARLIAALFTAMGESGVTTAGISEVSITGSTVRQTVDEAARVAGVSATSATGLIVSDNLSDPAAAVTCISLSYVNRGTVSGNRCRGGANGISPNTCQNLVISGNSVYGLSDSGVSLAACTGCSVTNNNLAGNAGFGVFELAGNASTLITGNVARGNTTGQINSAGTGSSSANNLTT